MRTMELSRDAVAALSGERLFVGEGSMLRVYHLSGATLESTITLPQPISPAHCISACNDQLVVYHPAGQLVCLDIKTRAVISSSSLRKLAASDSITLLQPSPRDDLFFFAVRSLSALHCLHRGNVSAPIDVAGKGSRTAELTAMACHPTESIVFLARYGNISAFSYGSILRGIVSRGEERTDEVEPGVPRRRQMQWMCDAMPQSSSREIKLLVANSEGSLLSALVCLNNIDTVLVFDVSSLSASQSMTTVGSLALKPGVTPLRMLFHSTEPVLYSLVEESQSNVKRLILQHHSLLFSDLVIFSATPLSDQASSNKTALHCTDSTGTTVVVSNSKIGTKTIVNQYPLTSFRFFEHSINSFSLPLEYFIDGDQGLQRSLGTYPILVLNPAVSTSATAPVHLRHHVFASKIAVNSKDSAAVKYLGCLDFKKAANSSGAPVNPKANAVPAVFIPRSPCLMFAGGCSLLEDSWFAVVNGCQLKRSVGEFQSPAACLIRYSGVDLSSTLIDCIWALPWMAVRDSGTQLGLLYIDSSRHRLHFSFTDNLRSLQSWEFDLDLQGVWAPLDRTGELALIAGTRKDSGARTLLYFCSAASMAVEDAANCLGLGEGEDLLQVEWLPTSARGYVVDMKETVAVCTSQRVLILNQKCEILSLIPLGNERYGSCGWIGLSLVLMTSEGKARCLTLGKFSSSPNFASRCSKLLEHGIDVNMSTDYDFFTFPNEFGNAVPRKIVCCFPDRVILSAQTPHVFESCMVKLLTKPSVPTEPLLLGLLRLYIASNSENSKNGIIEDMRVVLRLYYRTKNNSGQEYGASPTMQMSLTVTAALFCCGLFELSAMSSGIDLHSSPQTSLIGDGEFPRSRWIPSILKYEILVALQCYDRACFEFLIDHREALDLLMDPEKEGILVKRSSRLAQLCSSIAKDLHSLGQFELACLMADIAGDDVLLAMILKDQGNDDMLTRLCEELENIDQNTLNIIRANVLKTKLNDKACLTLSNVGGISRRQRLLMTFFRMSHRPILSDDARTASRKDFEMKGALGPMTRNGYLPMDSVEDWMGSQSVEVVAVAPSPQPFRTDGLDKLDGAESKPATWIEDVGKGKEWDLVIQPFQ